MRAVKIRSKNPQRRTLFKRIAYLDFVIERMKNKPLGFDRATYQREYMRKRRAKQRA